MTDKTLRRRLIRLAYERPDLRPRILPLVTKRAATRSQEANIYFAEKVREAVDAIENAVEGWRLMNPRNQAKFMRQFDRAANDFLTKVHDLYRSYAD